MPGPINSTDSIKANKAFRDFGSSLTMFHSSLRKSVPRSEALAFHILSRSSLRIIAFLLHVLLSEHSRYRPRNFYR